MSGADPSTAALYRATDFLRAQAARPWLDEHWTATERAVRVRVVGNWFSELDRLLRVLLDERAVATGKRAVRGHRGTLAKLGGLYGDVTWCEARIRGMARAHVTFRYTGGIAHRADVPDGDHMTVGWNGHTAGLHRVRLGDELRFGRAPLEQVCDFYDVLTDAASLPPIMEEAA